MESDDSPYEPAEALEAINQLAESDYEYVRKRIVSLTILSDKRLSIPDQTFQQSPVKGPENLILGEFMNYHDKILDHNGGRQAGT